MRPKITVSRLRLNPPHYHPIFADSSIEIELAGVRYNLAADDNGCLRLHIADDGALNVQPAASNAIVLSKAGQ